MVVEEEEAGRRRRTMKRRREERRVEELHLLLLPLPVLLTSRLLLEAGTLRRIRVVFLSFSFSLRCVFFSVYFTRGLRLFFFL